MPICLMYDDQSRCTIAHNEHLLLFSSMSHDPLFLASGLLGGLGHLTAGFLGLGHGLDDADSNGLEQDVSK